MGNYFLFINSRGKNKPRKARDNWVTYSKFIIFYWHVIIIFNTYINTERSQKFSIYAPRERKHFVEKVSQIYQISILPSSSRCVSRRFSKSWTEY
jgi:hypothetical protein